MWYSRWPPRLVLNRFIGTAGWALPKLLRDEFPDAPSGLARYAGRFDCVEINSSFHRRHRPETWISWAASVPADFRFSVKLPKVITHQNKLVDCDELVSNFASDTHGLGAKFAVALVQLPPKLAWEEQGAPTFLEALRKCVTARVVCEPRHLSWFTPEVDAILAGLGVSRVAADPALLPNAARPGGDLSLAYWRLHGSPQMYRSSYDADRLAQYAQTITDFPASAWVIFDNTASSAATENALNLSKTLTNGSLATLNGRTA